MDGWMDEDTLIHASGDIVRMECDVFLQKHSMTAYFPRMLHFGMDEIVEIGWLPSVLGIFLSFSSYFLQVPYSTSFSSIGSNYFIYFKL